jgi:hypothetical protein
MPFERDPDESLQLQVGRRVAELIAANYPGAGGAAHDALLALEMHTDQQIATTEAIAA